MKLIDILVEELPKRGGWMECVEHAWCDPDGEIRFRNGGCKPDFYPETDVDIEFRVPDASYEDDSRYIITREQYEAALAASKRCDHKWIPSEGRTQSGYLCSKCGNYDGPGYDWIDWGGGDCPVDGREMVDVIFGHGGRMSANIADCWRWSHDGTDSDIIAYRLHQPAKSEQVRADAWNAYAGITEQDDEADLNECIGHAPAPLWSGDGLPPVGCECEWQDKNTKQWNPVKVVYASEWVTVIREINKEKGDDLVEIAIENYGDDARLKFRPTRSEAERKRYDAVQALCDAGGGNGKVDEKSGYGYCWFDVYDAIAAGKIPGVKLED